jgi:hypothetical protein
MEINYNAILERRSKRCRMLYLNQQKTQVKLLKCEKESSFIENNEKQ